jgi:hypothetical protein
METGGVFCYTSQIYIGASSDNSTPYYLVGKTSLRIFSLFSLQTLMMSDGKDNTITVCNQSVNNSVLLKLFSWFLIDRTLELT